MLFEALGYGQWFISKEYFRGMVLLGSLVPSGCNITDHPYQK
jgi:hypothetical protein